MTKLLILRWKHIQARGLHAHKLRKIIINLGDCGEKLSP